MTRVLLAPLVAALYFFAPSLHAAVCSPSADVGYMDCDDEGEAYAAAWAAATEQAGRSNAAGGFTWNPMVEQEGNGYVGFVRPSYASSGRYASVKRGWKTKCSARPEEFGWEGGSTAASVNACHRGCMYSSALDPAGVAGFSHTPTGGTCTESDAPEPKPAGDGGGDDGGSTGGETGGGDGDGGGSDGGGDGGGDGGSGGGDGGGGGDGDGGENPSLPGDPQYPGDVPMPYMDPPIPGSYQGQWSSGLGGGSCPSPRTIHVSLGGYSAAMVFEFKPLCDFSRYIRGMVIAFAAIVAAYIVLGLRR
ncbi:virulence factor TspB C-terminal domain-related protein [Stenotrophomonas maltophilia]|uniref:virulence factor TspB C-terminal domain-related protein n=2 Tax=Stenotrophomonas maltophilia TaxID=40324 RepID=UPI0012F69DAE|nr:virulence factor TspB C-terminal domain-related protein [Stenotrophomonas maltophilia]MBA0463271.1 hypothetical protein [Stenotrophomonas maltophilia]QJC74794.1 hypothetical protein HGN30_12845 [Stenotrophomonas maltophilia]